MTSPHWNRVSELFKQALDLDDDERRALLRDAAPEIRREVESLLAFDSGDSTALDQDAPSSLIEGTSRDSLVGRTLGGYRIHGVLGRGGMGTVYEAEQERPRRDVALKMLRAGPDTERAKRRFEYESELLARLRHPHIAQVYEAGTFEADGRRLPFFAMERVENARTLDRFVQEEEPALRQRLQLFRKVCDAVQHANQRGIIHRDLKPQNILVDGRGEPKVIDFGVALSEDRVATLQTLAGQVFGTLQHMAPEQLEGTTELDARVDVYALGSILFELITGRPAMEIEDMPLASAMRHVAEHMVPRPSTVGGGGAELDWIVLRATDKDRERRYDSVAELGADIQRFLDHEPVLAGPPSATYRLRKLVRRHRTLATSVLLVLVILLVAVVMLWHQNTELQQARDKADKQTKVAQASLKEAEDAHARTQDAVEFLTRMLSESDAINARGPDLRVRDLLDEAAGMVADLERRPLIAAHLHCILGTSYGAMREHERALHHLKRSAELSRKHLGDNHANTLVALMAIVRVGVTQSRFLEIREQAQDVYDRCRTHLGETHALTLAAGEQLALVLRNVDGESEETLEFYRKIARLHTEAHGPEDKGTLTTAHNFADYLISLRKYDEARPIVEGLIETQTRLLGSDHPRTLLARFLLTTIDLAEGRIQEVEQELARLLPRLETRLGKEHANTLECRIHLLRARALLGRYAEIEEDCTNTLTVSRKVFGEFHPKTVMILRINALVHRRRGRMDKNLECIQAVNRINHKVFGAGNIRTREADNGLLSALLMARHFDEGLKLAKEQIAARQGQEPDVHDVDAWFLRGVLATGAKDYADAEKSLLHSRSLMRELPGNYDRKLIGVASRLAQLYRLMGKTAERDRWAKETRRLQRQAGAASAKKK